MFLNPNNLTDAILDIYVSNYIQWLKAVHNKQSIQTIHRYVGGYLAAEKCLEAVVGPNLTGQLVSQKRKFVYENYNDLI
jgi:hypothetical protein